MRGRLAGRLPSKWLDNLERPNDFLIRSNDLHEIRATDRAIRYARSEIVCLVQDDDLIPCEANWLDTAISRFTSDPITIIGGFIRIEDSHPDPAEAVPL